MENILLKEDGNYVLCDYGSCSLEILIPEVCILLLFMGVATAATAESGRGSL